MKKKLAAIIVCVLCAAFALCALAGCGGGNSGGGAAPGYKTQEATMTDNNGDLFTVKILNHEVVENNGKKYINIKASVTNKTNEELKVQQRLQSKAYQGDESNKLSSDSIEGTTVSIEKLGSLAPGNSGDIVLTYKLKDDTTPVTIEFYGYSSATSHVTFELPLS